MLDINSLLLILQSSSLTVTLSLAILLVFSWFHQPDTSRAYEQMRWCIIIALLLINAHPEYSNETIAEACGFSRSHLQVKFKESTGLTTNDWREDHVKNP